MGTFEIKRVDPGRETVVGVVGELYRLFLGAEWDHCQHWSKDLVAGDSHLIGGLGEYRGEVVIALPVQAVGSKWLAARAEMRPVLQAVVHVVGDLLELVH